MSQHCKIIITGKLIEGCDAEAVRASLTAAFKITEQQADRFLSGKPLIVKDNLDYGVAEKYRAAFEKAGLVCRLEPTAARSGMTRAADSSEPPASRHQAALYKVVFTGAVAPGNSVQDVKHALAQLYKTDSRKIERLFTGKPVVLKDRIDRRNAERLLAILEKTGAVCSLQPPVTAGDAEPAVPEPAASSGQSSREAPQVAADMLPQCPKCGYQAASAEDPLLTGQGGLGECPACGIIVAKYVRTACQPPASSDMPPAKDPEPLPGFAPAPAAAPEKKAVPPGTTTGIEVTPRFFPLAPLLYFCYPHVEIDGEACKTDWGKTTFYPLLPGTYAIRIYVPYPSKPEYGLISKEITVGDKNPCRLDFYLFPWISSPGSLTVDGIPSGSGSKGAQPSDQEAGSAWLRIAGQCRAIFSKLVFWKKQEPHQEE